LALRDFLFSPFTVPHADDAAVQEARAFCTEMRVFVFVLLAYWPAITDSPKAAIGGGAQAFSAQLCG
jgi:hypothetical protein